MRNTIPIEMIRHAIWSQNNAHARAAVNRAAAEMASVFEYLEPHPRADEDEWNKENELLERMSKCFFEAFRQTLSVGSPDWDSVAEAAKRLDALLSAEQGTPE